MNAEEKKKLVAELESTGFAKPLIEAAMKKVPSQYKRERAEQWCVDWILEHPDGDKGGSSSSAAASGSGGAGAAMADVDDPLSQIMAMGFTSEEAKEALEEYGDPSEAIIGLLATADKRAAEAAAKRAEQAKEEEKKAKEVRAKAAEAKRASRLKLMVSNLYKTACAFKPDAKTEIKDRMAAVFALSTLYEPIEEEMLEKQKADAIAAASGKPIGKGGKNDSKSGGSGGGKSGGATTAAAAAASGGGGGKPKSKAQLEEEAVLAAAIAASIAASAPAAASSSSSAAAASATDVKSKKPVIDPKKMSADCTVCRSDWDNETVPCVFTNCGHALICKACFGKYITIKVRDKQILPWITCSGADCKVPLSPKDIDGSSLTTPELYNLLLTYMQKTLARESQWVECTNEKACKYGFWLEAKEIKEMDAKNTAKKGSGYKQMSCGVCGTSQKVAPKIEELDPEFKKMIAEGKLRPCPKCQHHTLKEYGVCNVIECAKCGIWWNWRSRETGRTSRELKDRARSHGTLWEAGELEFQQKLERTNKAEFIKFLARQGIKYDPNYSRGSG